MRNVLLSGGLISLVLIAGCSRMSETPGGMNVSERATDASAFANGNSNGDSGGPREYQALASPETLTVSLMRQRAGKIITVSGNEKFVKDDGARLNISVVEEGFLSIIYKGSSDKSAVLFPSKAYNDGSNKIKPGQIISVPDRGWFFFDRQKGVETIFVIFSKEKPGDKNTPAADVAVRELEKAQSDNNGQDAFVTEQGSLVRVVRLVHE